MRSLNYFNTDVMSRVAAARGIVDDTERLTEYAALEKQIVEEDLCMGTHVQPFPSVC